MSSKSSDPTSRTIRRVLQALHLVVAVGFCVLLAIGAWRGVDQVRPSRPLKPMAAAGCVQMAGQLRQELLERLASFPHAVSAAEEGRAFENWSVEFRGRLVDAAATCRSPEGATAEQKKALRDAFTSVTRSLDLSAITATHWARHLGPSLDESAEAIEEAARATSR